MIVNCLLRFAGASLAGLFFFSPLASANLTSKQTAPTAGDRYNTIDAVAELFEGRKDISYFGLADSNGKTLDVLDVVETKHPNHRYIGLSHSSEGKKGNFCVNLSSSQDLRTWIRVAQIDCWYASQPAIRLLKDGSYLVSYESGKGDNARVKIRYYENLESLLANRAVVSTVVRKTPRARADGTPSFREIIYDGGGFRAMRFELTTHVNYRSWLGNLKIYRDVLGFKTFNWPGVSTGFNTNNNCMHLCWPLNPLINSMGVRGNIGGRDSFEIGGHRYFIVEGQTKRNDWSAWNLYLVQEGSNQIRKLNIQMPDGVARSHGNPKISFLTLPNGRAAIVGTSYIFSETPGGRVSNVSAGPFLWARIL